MTRATLVALVVATAGCKRSAQAIVQETPAVHDDDDDEEQEEQDRERDNFWRAQIVIVGAGAVKTTEAGFDCASDGVTQHGQCGPKLLKFKEMRPALLHATPAPGWRLDAWKSLIREPDGTTHPRKGPMPDGVLYLNGFGYADTGELETVTAVFVRAP